MKSTITCPECGHKEKEKIPKDMCLYFYECKRCEYLMRPILGHCCVFCTHGDVPCQYALEREQSD